jgi:hypothetical protein
MLSSSASEPTAVLREAGRPYFTFRAQIIASRPAIESDFFNMQGNTEIQSLIFVACKTNTASRCGHGLKL